MQYLTPFFVSLVISLTLTPFIRQIAMRYNLVAEPKGDRWHKNPTAIMGGIAIFTSFMITYLFQQTFSKEILGILAGATVVFIWGLLDDIFNVSPQIKMLGQIIAACVAIFVGLRLNVTSFDFLNIILTLFWILTITNAFNLIDNMDGLSCGLAFIASAIIFISSLISRDRIILPFAVILCGATLGFLPYNFNPAKIFMGDTGSMFLGFILSTIVILKSTRHISNFVATLAVPVLIMAVPIFDTALVSLIRNLNGRSMFQGGRDHTSHRLVSLGLSERKTVLLLYLVSIVFGLIALGYSKVDIIIVSILAVLALIVFIFFGIFLAEIKTYNDTTRLEEERKKKLENGKTILNTFIFHKRRILEVAVDLILICISYYTAYLLRFEGSISEANLSLISQSLPWIIIFRLICFYYFGLYRGIWHYISISDLISIFKAVSLSSLAIIMLITFLFRFKDYSRVVFFIDWLLLLFMLSGIRISIRFLRESFIKLNMSLGKRILIFGAGDLGEAVLREIKRSRRINNYNPIGFIDDDLSKVGRKIHNIPVLGTRKDIIDIVKTENVEEIFLAISSFREQDISDILNLCENYKIKVRRIAGMLDFESG